MCSPSERPLVLDLVFSSPFTTRQHCFASTPRCTPPRCRRVANARRSPGNRAELLYMRILIIPTWSKGYELQIILTSFELSEEWILHYVQCLKEQQCACNWKSLSSTDSSLVGDGSKWVALGLFKTVEILLLLCKAPPCKYLIQCLLR